MIKEIEMENDFGFVRYGEESDPIFDEEGNETDEKAYILIDLVYVKPEYRRQGYARKLLTETLAEIRAESDLPIFLAALPKDDTIDMESLVSFYESVDFTPTDEQGSAAVVMEYDF
jgi:GNAT superfamily N-acetyltransferase